MQINYRLIAEIEDEEIEVRDLSLVQAFMLTDFYVDPMIIRQDKLTDDEYQILLERQRDRIASGLKREFWDDTTIGSKETVCSWGLSCTDYELRPEITWAKWPLDHPSFMYPVSKQRLYGSPSRQTHHKCPLDLREKGPYNSGCFYHCAMFSQPRDKQPGREQVIELYDKILL